MKGTYTLIIELAEDFKIKVGALGQIKFCEGAYAYVGSAMRSLEGRVKRHFSEEKNLHWHIDYLLYHSEIELAIFGESDKRKECELAGRISEKFSMIEHFGATDCDCRSHLFFSKSKTRLIEGVKSSFEEVNLVPEEW
ncbi:MAG: GIY-YIG nuclease family protein [Candidatus Hadarchaeia archaeon]